MTPPQEQDNPNLHRTSPSFPQTLFVKYGLLFNLRRFPKFPQDSSSSIVKLEDFFCCDERCGKVEILRFFMESRLKIPSIRH